MAALPAARPAQTPATIAGVSARHSYTTSGDVTLLAGPMAANAVAVNVIGNAGFESGVLTPWVQETGTPFVSNAQAHSGTYSAAAFGSDSIRQNFDPVAVSDILEFSLWIYRPDLVFDVYNFFYSDGTQSNALLIQIPNPSDIWVFADLTSQLSAGKYLTGFQIYGTSAGPAYFDDVSLLVNAVPEPGTLALLGLGLLGLGSVATIQSRPTTVTVNFCREHPEIETPPKRGS